MGSVGENTYVGLTEVTVDANLRAGVHDTAVLLLLEDGPDSLSALVGATEIHINIRAPQSLQKYDSPQVDSKNSIPLSLGHGLEGLVAEDTCIGNQDVDTAELLKSNGDNLLAVLSRADGGSGLSSSLGDLVNDGVGALFADIVNDDVGAELGVHEGVCPSETSTGTGDQDGLSVEADLGTGLGVGRELLCSLKQALSTRCQSDEGISSDT